MVRIRPKLVSLLYPMLSESMSQVISYVKENDWVKSSIVTIVFGLTFFLANNPNLVHSISNFPWVDFFRVISPIIAVFSLVGTVILYRRQRTLNRYRQELLEQLKESQALNESDNDDPYSHKSQAGSEDSISNLTVDRRNILESEIDRVSGFVSLTPDGEILLSEDAFNRSTREKILLYLIGKTYAAEVDLVDSKVTTVNELASQFSVSKSSIFHAIQESPYIEKTNKGQISAYLIKPENIQRALDSLN